MLQRSWCKGVWMGFLSSALQFSISTSSSPAPHIAVHINYQWNICVLLPPPPPPTILSSLGSVQTWEHKYLYQLYTLSWIFIMRVELQCFLYIHLYFFLVFWRSWRCIKKLSFTMRKKTTLSWALCKLKARGSLEYLVRHPRKHLRVPWQRINTNVQPLVFLMAPARVPWHFHSEEPPKLF